jgi:hypothetical protein
MNRQEELKFFRDKVEQIRRYKLANYLTKKDIADILLMEDLEAESRHSLAHNHELLERIDLLLGILEGIGELIIKFKKKKQEAI